MSQTKVEAPFVENNSPFRNLIINGDMKIAQRATGATTVSNNTVDYTTVDRWFVYEYSDGVITSEQHDMSAADQATTGQKKAMELNVTTVDSSIASGQFALFAQAVEAQFCQPALYGTSAAKNLTLSFWVKTNKTGTYSVTIDKNDSTRYRLPITYTVSSADTWEKKVINISPTAGSTSLITGANGAIADDNGVGFHIWWTLAAGSDFQGTNNTWTSSEKYTTSDQVNWLDSTSNNFHITGVQLEVADQASDFEHLPFDVSLIRCQRYFEVMVDGRSVGSGTLSSGDSDEDFPGTGVNYNTEFAYMPLKFATTKRSNAPSLLTTNDTNHFRLYSGNSNDQLSTVFNAGVSSHHNLTIYFDYGSSGGWTQGDAAFARCNNANAFIMIKDEL